MMIIEKVFDWGFSIIRTILIWIERKILPHAKYIVLFLGVIIYAIARVNIVIAPIFESTVLVGEDDSYAYVVNGIKTETCFLHDCLALEELTGQLLNPSPVLNVAQQRHQQYHRIYNFYWTLYSIIFSGIHSTDISPETTYKIISIAGTILLHTAICYWLFSMWGPGAAGITLGILAFSIPIGGYGYRPSNMALGLAIFSWIILLRNLKRKDWIVPLLIFAMSAVHSIGQLYAIITLSLYVLHSKWPFKKNTWWGAGISLTIIITFLFLLPLIPGPYFFRWDPGQFYSGAWSRQEVILQAFEIVIGNFKWLGSTNLGLLSAGILIILGFISANPKKRNGLFAICGLLAVLYFASIFYIGVPWFPGVITRRVWVPLRIILLGAIGYTLWLWAKTLISKLIRYVHDRSNNSIEFNTILSNLSQGIVILSVIVFIFINRTYVYNESLNGRQYQASKERHKYLSYILDPAQPEVMLSQIEKDDVVLYMHELPFYFFLSHGALQHRAVYYPAVANSPEQKEWIDENDDIRYLVAFNPIHVTSAKLAGVIPITKDSQLIIESESSFDLTTVELLLSNQGDRDVLLTIEYSENGDGEKQKQIIVPAGETDWFSITSEENIWLGEVELKVEKKWAKLSLEGLHIQANEHLNWPWDQGVTLLLNTTDNADEEPLAINFDYDTLDAGLGLQLQVIADDGVTVLAVVNR